MLIGIGFGAAMLIGVALGILAYEARREVVPGAEPLTLSYAVPVPMEG